MTAKSPRRCRGDGGAVLEVLGKACTLDRRGVTTGRVAAGLAAVERGVDGLDEIADADAAVPSTSASGQFDSGCEPSAMFTR